MFQDHPRSQVLSPLPPSEGEPGNEVILRFLVCGRRSVNEIKKRADRKASKLCILKAGSQSEIT